MKRLTGAIGALLLAMALLAPAASATNYTQTNVVGAGAGLPYGVAFDQSNDYVYLAESVGPTLSFPGNVSRFDSTGAPLSPATMSGGVTLFAGVTVNQTSHNVYATSIAVNPALHGFDQAGAALGAPYPVALGLDLSSLQPAIAANGDIIVPRIAITPGVKLFDPATGAVNSTISCSGCPAPASFARPTAAAVDSSGNIYIADAGTAIPEKQVVTIAGGPSGGSFTLTFDGQTTASILYNASANAVRDALFDLSNIGDNQVKVAKSGTLPADVTYTVTFYEKFLAKDVPEMTCDSSGLTGGTPSCSLATTQTADIENSRLIKFGPLGDADPTAPIVVGSGNVGGVAVNPANDHVFVSGDDVNGYQVNGYHITEYDETGAEVSDFGLGEIENGKRSLSETALNPPHLAVNGDTGDVYVSDINTAQTNGFARVYSPIPAPTVTADVASGVGGHSATLNATVNPNGESTIDCHFEYTDHVEFLANGWANAQTAACDPNPFNNSSDTAVSADVGGLSATTMYDYRIVETTEGGTATDEGQFTTLTPPAATTGAASAITQNAATLAATVNPNGEETTDCRIEWGLAVGNYSSGQAACSPDPGEASIDTEVSVAASGLVANTTYHYRVVETTAGGTANGADMTFATLADTCETNAALCPPPPDNGNGGSTPPPPTDNGGEDNKGKAQAQCIKKANMSFKKAMKAAKKKKGKARAKAMKSANKAKAKAIKRCKALKG